ncbi:MAG: glycosyl transferase family 4 [Sideroxydans sp.]|nr:glycosyl transferase family 4 [Sideroxydans sp.]
MTPHYAPVIAALITLLLTTLLLISKATKGIEDIPNERSLHAAPVPRIGGVGLMAGLLSGWAIMLKSLAWWVVLPVIILFAISLMDDMRGLTPRVRLLVHFIAAFILLLGSGMLLHNVLIGLFILFGVVWMTNLYNFMDGSDGLAGGMTFWGFTMYGAAALMHGNDTQAMLNFSVGAAALGFLYNNFHPAKVFMGDAGSIPLGFLAAAMGLWGWQQSLWPAWFPLLVFSPFIVDATVTLLKRALRGEKVWEAHREHYYQRLVQLGWGHYRTAVVEYVLMFAAGVSAIWSMRQSAELPWLLFLAWGVVYAVLMLILDRRWQVFQREQHGQI